MKLWCTPLYSQHGSGALMYTYIATCICYTRFYASTYTIDICACIYVHTYVHTYMCTFVCHVKVSWVLINSPNSWVVNLKIRCAQFLQLLLQCFHALLFSFISVACLFAMLQAYIQKHAKPASVWIASELLLHKI